jgi:S1-C subfamily serine protease
MKKSLLAFVFVALFAIKCFGQNCLIRCEPDKNTGGACGSGFFISPNEILTANHVIDGSDKVRVEFDNQYYPIEVLKTDKNKDLALLKINKQNKFYVIGEEEPKKEDNVICKGFPKAVWTLHKSYGKIKDIRLAWRKGNKDNAVKQYSVWMSVEHGMSGGPLLNEDNKFIGVLSTKNVDGLVRANFTSLEEIKKFLND